MQVGEKGSNLKDPLTGPVTSKGGLIVGSVDPQVQQVSSAVSSSHLSSQLRSHWALTNGGAIVGLGVAVGSVDPHVQQVPSVVSSSHLCSQFMSHWPLTIGGAIVGWGVTLHSQVVPSVV